MDFIIWGLIYVVSAVALSVQIRAQCESDGLSTLIFMGQIECKVLK